ncbi:TMEM175 family protein [Kitasatospora paranensis]|uniref:TMEM175 family protein n=1 Tax=Kitasatospora paranensis TaxID=258053 RepID=A0ABW2FN12_9ACTN
MRARKLRRYEERATDRMIFFSDAVVAIAITLLALELPVPEGRTVAEFGSAVGDDLDHYLAFLISFAVIGAAWGQHNGSSAGPNAPTRSCACSTRGGC